ncbi:hypothetical protein B9Z55_029130 [Caenorhabditis nigoni]|nr:hypothetical protein B9Z55_029130 [Caenorhabditis nigoni]
MDHLSDALTKKDAKFQWNAQWQVSFGRAKLFLEGNLPHYQDSHCYPILTASNFLTASDFDYHCFKFYLINIIDRVCYLKRFWMVAASNWFDDYCSFLGFILFYGSFIKKLFKLCSSLDVLTKKDVKFQLTAQCQSSFARVK